VEIRLSFNHTAGYGRVVPKWTGRSRPSDPRPDPFQVLGLAGDATLDEIEVARRTLAKSAHPDAGGSVAEMQRINAAADEAALVIAARQSVPETPPPSATGPQLQWRIDHPSFTIEALPAEGFEALLVVAGWMGETIDDDPPYRLDVELGDPFHGWCRLELMPDAGATTVSLALVTERGVDGPDVEAVRDAWIAGLNSLDWAAIGDSRLQP
jgi:hypothetical protein